MLRLSKIFAVALFVALSMTAILPVSHAWATDPQSTCMITGAAIDGYPKCRPASDGSVKGPPADTGDFYWMARSSLNLTTENPG